MSGNQTRIDPFSIFYVTQNERNRLPRKRKEGQVGLRTREGQYNSKKEFPVERERWGFHRNKEKGPAGAFLCVSQVKGLLYSK